MNLDREVHVVSNTVRGEFFFTEHHGEDVVAGRRIRWTLTGKLPGPGTWVSCTMNLPHAVSPRPGVEDGVVRTRTDYVRVYEDDCHEVLVEDIVDTGLTMNYLKTAISSRKPKTLTTVTLLEKPDALKVPCEIDLVGFKIPNDFVVGYGLDYQGFYRNLPYIAQVQNFN